ncbi:transporter substrate-binding domain-containing protein [Puniceibacterium sp. IMCC21224]|uniref:transporter substrate-binding domain-containing protein n=1 Tax=Puniceibacterium sp. IMCC21224 TaxID=1618204 RepID=UPI00064DCFF2|nr:transporter substrate-binding domain-containing protein [Puniceibacterium sp. IMCC21224]KMK67109.1 periplasmic component of amino acid ABC-type transporter/signal transduction system [Puniceibacterium sp. IMCC21224]
MRKHILAALAGAAFVIGSGVPALAQDALERVMAAGVLKVGTETAFAPFDFVDAGTHTGLNTEIYAEIGKDMGVEIEWITLDWTGVLPGLEAGRFDVVAGPATITKERMERYRFSSPIAEATVALLVGAGSDIAAPADIAGKPVGSGTGTAQLAQLQTFGATLDTPPTEYREYVSFNESYADLAAGRIEAVANSLPNIAFVASQRPEVFKVVTPAFGTPTYFGFPGRIEPEFASLMDKIDEILLAMKADGRMEALQEKWFGTTFDMPDYVTEPNI